jgi:DNA-binding MarR family transcriptional regulator
VTAGELKSRGYYQGSNVSYKLKKLVEMDYMHHQRCEIDRRSVRVRLTEQGRAVCDVVARLFAFAKLQLQMMGAFAEFERNIIRKRQAEGIAKAIRHL